MKNVIAVLLFLLLSGSCGMAAELDPKRQEALGWYQEANFQEYGAGDLEKAIGIYEMIFTHYSQYEDICAVTLISIARCYENLDRLVEAVLYYRLVITWYPKNTQKVREAQLALKHLKREK
ncbi:hypothetical protein KAR34_08010 [bacterium]|nr:hypothetical protein [bacterium]